MQAFCIAIKTVGQKISEVAEKKKNGLLKCKAVGSGRQLLLVVSLCILAD